LIEFRVTQYNPVDLSNKTKILEKLNGILLPSTTPFTSDGEVDARALKQNLSKWLSTGIRGVVMLGSTGERVHLDEREYLRVIELSRNEVASEHAFIVGAGQQSALGTIAEIKRAAEAGADAVLVITPSFYRSAMTQEVLGDFFVRVADQSPVPVLLYSMPALTGIKIESSTIAKLTAHSNIIGVKDSSNDVQGFKSTVALCPKDFAVMTGNGTVVFDTLQMGATGGILAVGCVVPEVCLEIFKLFRQGEVDRARLLQSHLTPLAAAVTTRFGIGGLKIAMDIRGYTGGFVRAPLTAPNHDAREELGKLLEGFQLKPVVS
jgi:4-hydroxy-2-oxoglutarate aldolase